MALVTSLPALLTTLTQSLSAAVESTPDSAVILPPQDGISLLDLKNELLLSYLQNLVFLILLKLRSHRDGTFNEEGSRRLDDEVVKKLVELRVYLEKGVRRLEGRLQYQIDKVLRAADDAARADTVKANGVTKKLNSATAKDSDASDDSDDDDEEEEQAGAPLQMGDIDDLAYRPNPGALVAVSNQEQEDEEESYSRKSSDGIYRPPRITATAMPTTGPREHEARRPQKSATLDEFVSTELSTAPTAEPSIGSNIVFGGRRSKSERERQDEAERTAYEERNYVRLPKESKKDKRKKPRARDAGYGGEEWRGLGEGIDRIERLTKRKSNEGRSVLEKSRKRPTEDGPRNDGAGGADIGQGFQKRLKTLDAGRRDRGKRNKS